VISIFVFFPYIRGSIVLKLKSAQKIVKVALDMAREKNMKPLAIAVVDARGALVAFAAEDGSSLKPMVRLRLVFLRAPLPRWRLIVLHSCQRCRMFWAAR
jgi:hypothetical protein